jgi:hypothetical protein
MENTEYLYGAAVQGIQDFIFQTNKLKDIVGASELVEQICTVQFATALNKTSEELKEDPNAITTAAGNIKYVFQSREECERVVRNFPKEIIKMAPGITISQAVVKMTDNFQADVKQLEQRLHTQRNKPMRSTTLGITGMLRSRTTGLPAVDIDKIDKKNWEYLDESTLAKRKKEELTHKLCEKSFGRDQFESGQITSDIDKFVGKNDWIAIIHADGNSLGQVVRKLGADKADFRKFSQSLDRSTIAAANLAFQKVKEEFKIGGKSIIPLRPIVLGGDDMTIICRADIAISYTQEFLRVFEKETAENLGPHHVFNNGKDRLTACAGIAFIKSSFPFHYGYHLAEALCSRAKKDAKSDAMAIDGLPLSCLMFHKVQDSFVEKYEEIVKRELTPQESLSFEFGPYYLSLPNGEKDRWTIDRMMEKVMLLKSKEGNAVKSHLRQWITILSDSGSHAAELKMDRVVSIIEDKNLGELLSRATTPVTRGTKAKALQCYPTYDILSIFSIMYQETNKVEDQ